MEGGRGRPARGLLSLKCWAQERKHYSEVGLNLSSELLPPHLYRGYLAEPVGEVLGVGPTTEPQLHGAGRDHREHSRLAELS